MWTEFFRFDLRYHLRQPLLWVMAIALMAIAFTSAGSDAMRVGGAIGNVLLNAPVVIARQLSVLSIISMFLVVVFIAGAVLRDSEVGIADLLFATPIGKRDYLLGRFLAGFSVCLLIFALITLAMMLGAQLPSIDPERLGPFSLTSYAWAFGVFVVPNLLFIAALLLLLAAVTRSLIIVHVGVLAFMVLWAMAGSLRDGAGSESIAVLLDPFGIRALTQATRYFSAAQSNSELPALSGLLLINRLMWTGIALGLFAATAGFFKLQQPGRGRRRWRAANPVDAPTSPTQQASPRRILPQFSAGTTLPQLWSLLRFDARSVLKSLPFLIMLLLALANFVTNYSIGGLRFDSTPYPLTRLLLEELDGGIGFVLVIVVLFYSGELVFRDRQVRIADVTDALPVPVGAQLLAKVGALCAVILAFLCSGVVVAIGIQSIKGGAPIEIGLYAQSTLLSAAYYAVLAASFVAIHACVPHKFVGHLLALALLASGAMLSSIGVSHPLWRFNALPALTYSDINGYGHLLQGWRWYALYWGCFAAVLLLLALVFSSHGRAAGLRARLAVARQRLHGRMGVSLAVALTGFFSVGAWIYYNTSILNQYESSATQLDHQAEYERRYRKYLAVPSPSLTRVETDVAIFPAERRATIRGRYELQNRTNAAVDTLVIQTDRQAVTTFEQLPAHRVDVDDAEFGFRVLTLERPLAPGERFSLGFRVEASKSGFDSDASPGLIHGNGTMLTSENYFPKFGYVQAYELEDRNERRERGLGEPQRMPKLEDLAARQSNYWKLWGFDADFIAFDATISTSADQSAVAPGRLVKTWEQDGRRYFHYVMDRPILPFFSFQSGRWQVASSDWHGLPIEVYHDPKHGYNTGSMIRGTQQALDYFTEHFGPYPHASVRIVEFPLYQGYARSLPGVIPFSESLGFINDVRDPDGVDHVFYITAHELAHQWWGDQAIAANVQGGGMITESLAEYSALMVMEKVFGAEKVRRILRYDLDQYLAGRGQERVEELPLYRSENQVYVQYRKGSMAFYRLREVIGEAALNRALRRFLDEHRYRTRPYVTSEDLLAAIRAEAPADAQTLITDLFQRIVVYDNRVVSADAKPLADGQWRVTFKLRLSKSEADGKGKETPRDYDEPVDLAIFARGSDAQPGSERVLWRQQRSLPAGESTIEVTVGEAPFEVGVDPYNLLIDRAADDNRKRVSVAE
ncbi:ABC transporter permease/M1 family aminopeptidase [Tahibacter amnicola]|uniref:M1 family aminopeptidase n=1 Tax=Tahibacter amnicola TaxID=2976241 RepID=A0ABY6BIW0_9GAMM|nr:M1 family aminopeptidase [Tahibacter amnicola]UXI69035.1 M1 family aminopeptidase [Tahibacter amnicola]